MLHKGKYQRMHVILNFVHIYYSKICSTLNKLRQKANNYNYYTYTRNLSLIMVECLVVRLVHKSDDNYGILSLKIGIPNTFI